MLLQVGNSNYTISLVDGTATKTLKLNAGTYNIIATYLGDNNYFFSSVRTNNYGYAELGISLPPGNYIMTARNTVTGEYYSNSITVLSLLLVDMDMYYRNGSAYTAIILDGHGKPMSGAKVSFNINGVYYNVVTNSKGEASLPIGLLPGKYIITTIHPMVKYIPIQSQFTLPLW